MTKPKKAVFKVTVEVPEDWLEQWPRESIPHIIRDELALYDLKATVTRYRKPRTVHRSAVTGKYVSKAKAKKRPRETVRERK